MRKVTHPEHSMRVGLLMLAILAGTTAGDGLALDVRAAQPPIRRIRSIIPLVEIHQGEPRIVLIARGPTGDPEVPMAEVRQILDPAIYGLHREPFRESFDRDLARRVRWFHLVHRSGPDERVLGAVLEIADEMPTYDGTGRSFILSLPHLRLDFDLVKQQIVFEPDLARASQLPAFVHPEALRGLRVALLPELGQGTLQALGQRIRQLGAVEVPLNHGRVDVVVIPPKVDFVDVRDREAEVKVSRGASVIHADRLLPAELP